MPLDPDESDESECLCRGGRAQPYCSYCTGMRGWKSDAKPPEEPPDDDTDSLLATLRAQPAKPELPRFRAWEAARGRDAIIHAFLFDYLLLKKPVRRGNRCGTPSIQVCSLYRLYLAWSWSLEPMNPRQFALALGRAGIKRRRVFRQDDQSFLLVFTREGSKRLIAWLEENPDPYEWPQTFAKQVGPNTNEAASSRKKPGKAAGNIPPGDPA